MAFFAIVEVIEKKNQKKKNRLSQKPDIIMFSFTIGFILHCRSVLG